MFAKQIAVMKGQAWNVVETLKTADHGPLELTRRTRVCVWDDLVDVPVAIPLRSPSAEMRRQRGDSLRRSTEDDEIDIGAVARPNGLTNRDDLLKFPANDALPTPNRFSLSRTVTNDTDQLFDHPATPATIHGGDLGLDQTDRKDFINGTALRPAPARSSTHVSFEVPRKDRRPSTSSRDSNPRLYYDSDEGDGDLGYAAAQVTEKHTRKVIVERLEAVKSKNPVFTWC